MPRSFQIVSPDAPTGPGGSGVLGSRGKGQYVVATTNLSVVYSRVAVLRDIDLQVGAGECIALMGPNGAGKSTLLGSLVGVVQPAAGQVSWFGGAARNRELRRQIGFAGQEPGLYAELTAQENLIFSGRMYGVENVQQRVQLLLEECSLSSQAHRPVGQLSQGMRQRLTILRAVVHRPQLVVLDEPSARLDSTGQEWLARLLTLCRNNGQSVCFASHDADECRDLADRIVHLDAGRIATIEQVRASHSHALLRSA
jgi:heme exporter protein A